MAFDAGMLSCVLNELNGTICGGKTEKVYQPEKDEIVLLVRSHGASHRLVINVGSVCPRIGLTDTQKENPMQAPMFCMLLRKHLTGATISEISQIGFERVAKLTFETRDEMGFECKKYIFAEIMGKYSNLIFTDENSKIISSIKTVDFSTSSLRQVLPGMIYELPPSQNKQNPLEECEDGFSEKIASFYGLTADKFITYNYLGISSSNAREICYRATGETSPIICNEICNDLSRSFFEFVSIIKNNNYSPCVIFDKSLPIEYSFTSLLHYASGVLCKNFDSVSRALDVYFENRDKEQRIKQRATDIYKLLTNAESRLVKKLDSQRTELADCEKGDQYRKYGDLITSNIYKLSKGQTTAQLDDYDAWDEELGEYSKITVLLDSRISPSANAQRYYKKYNKAKNAKIELSKQIAIGEKELDYIHSVFEALTKAETSSDLAEIRDELFRSGYASKMRGYVSTKKHTALTPALFLTTNGYKVYCGKNNVQNEYITHKLAEKNDYWFHAKNTPGSHVILVTNGEEPPARDFTDACMIAAYYSKARGGESIEVDYLFARGVKKVAGSKPGFVIYNNNWSAYVTPDEEKVLSMRQNK